LNSINISGRDIREISFEDNALTIGGFAALDYFGDGSFYLLDTPGHCVGHISALVRCTATTPTFMFLAGDCAHHAGMLRPSPFAPLPSSLYASLPRSLVDVCTPSTAQDTKDNQEAREARSYTSSFLEQAPPSCSVHADLEETKHTVEKLKVFDGHPDVLVILSHDSTLAEYMKDLNEVNGWKAQQWKEKTFWTFIEHGDMGKWWKGADDE
jgi:hypothetical protein